ncbi:MAG: hypothetical protein RLZZ450_4545 [Pseudomonadota bacterium]|jgi:hypothetical protein
MPSWFQLAQLAVALFLSIVIGRRVHALYYRDATSEEAFRWLLRTLQSGEREAARAWARARPRAQLARMIELAATSSLPAAELRELIIDLRDESTASLRMLRVSATLVSTLGLMGGILTLALGSSRHAGLMALQAGRVERMTMNEALATMAIGVATSALCFQAVALLRPAAQRAILQVRQLERWLTPPNP